MDDVIFAGSQTRKPVNIAEVNLYINNEDKVLATDQTQVVLTRRLNRNGASDFLINKETSSFERHYRLNDGLRVRERLVCFDFAKGK